MSTEKTKLKELSKIQKKFILEDYPEGKTVVIGNLTFVVVKNDCKTMELKPTQGIWYKPVVKEDGKLAYRQIIKGKIVETPGN